MEILKRFLTDEEVQVFKRYLNIKDYIKVAEDSGFGVSTVNNMVAQRTKINSNNFIVLKNLNKTAYKKALEKQAHLKKDVKTLKLKINE